MSAESQPAGNVFVSHAHGDAERIRPLVQFLRTRFSVWWDEQVAMFRSYTRYRVEEADCVLVIWTPNSVALQYVQYEADWAQRRGIVVPVLLDGDAEKIPSGLTQVPYIDLTRWQGGYGPMLQPLMDRIHRLLTVGPVEQTTRESLPTTSDVVAASVEVTAQLRDFTGRISSIKEILLDGSSPQVADLLAALAEVDKTYDLVNEAIEDFMAPLVTAGPIDPAPFLKLERGLPKRIMDERGHCHVIDTYYFSKPGGIRDWLKTKVDPDKFTTDKFQAVDDAFWRLAKGDMDLFDVLVNVAKVLTLESRAVVNLLAQGQEEAARKRILEGRQKLQPLEDELSSAMEELQKLEQSLGYVRRK